MCLFPRYIKNKRYEKTEKNGGYPRKLRDYRKRWIAIPCGECIECKKKAANDWRIRLCEEAKSKNEKLVIVTLSFSPEALSELTTTTGLEECNAIATIAVRRFLERWRRSTGKSVKHWLVTELGHENSERIHLHGFLWTNKSEQFINDKWKYGNIKFGYNSGSKTLAYVTKYVRKHDKAHPDYRQIVLTSPGIGKEYITRTGVRHTFSKEKTIQTYKCENGFEVGLPKYYRYKLWSESQRGYLWTKTLDKNEVFCQGVKYELNNPIDERRYKIALNEARKYNKYLRYGCGNYKKRKRIYNITKYMLMNYKELLACKEKKVWIMA